MPINRRHVLVAAAAGLCPPCASGAAADDEPRPIREDYALTLLAAMSTDVFRAAASFSGSPDARAFFRRFPEDIRFDTADPLEFEMRSAACFAESFKCPVLMLHGSGEGGSEAAVRLTVERARAVGLDVRRGVVEGDHNSAIPGESEESLRFFAGV